MHYDPPKPSLVLLYTLPLFCPMMLHFRKLRCVWDTTDYIFMNSLGEHKDR